MIYFTSHIQKFCGKTALQLYMSNNNKTLPLNKTVVSNLFMIWPFWSLG